MKVLWIDPGLSTGVAYINTEKPKEWAGWIVEGGVKGFAEWWKREGVHLFYDVAGYESFEREEGTGGIKEDASEVIGFLKANFPAIVKQRRMQRGQNDLVTDAVLKRAGLYPPRGQVGAKHHIEALRHALSYLCQKRSREILELLHPRKGN